MRLKYTRTNLCMLALIATNASASELDVDLNRLSNFSEVGTNRLSITSEFIGYELDEGKYRYARDVDLKWFGLGISCMVIIKELRKKTLI